MATMSNPPGPVTYTGPPEGSGPPARVTNRRWGGWFGVVVRALFALGLFGVLAGGLIAVGGYAWFARDLPRLDTFEDLVGPGLTQFEAADGQIVGEWSHQRRVALRWDQLPRHLVLSFLAAEDARFFGHGGIDLKGIARAFVTNVKAGRIREGASTITQQLAKQLVGAEKSYERKIREAILARRIEDIYSKQQILTWYMNIIYLGHGSYGVQAAAQNYFRKDVWDLSLAEMAMIGGLPQSPSRVNPARNMDAARERMEHVLAQLLRRGWITDDEHDAAVAAELKVYPVRDRLGSHVPYYTEHVRKEIAKKYGPLAGEDGTWLDLGLTVSMAVEPAHQRIAAQAVAAGLEDLARRQGYPGPFGQLELETFLERSSRYLPADGPAPGDRLLARVSEVSGAKARLQLSDTHAGTALLEEHRWAAPYSEFPKRDDGGRERSSKVSFKGRLRSMKDIVRPGDVVLVEVGKGSARKLQLSLVPVPMMQAAMVSYPTISGGVDVMVGGWDFDRSQVNRAFALRQTGSTMKPIVYGKAYDLGLAPSALFSGAPFREGGYNPTGARTKEDMLLWDALAKSENSVSLRVLKYVLNHTTLDDYREWGRKLGLSRELQGHTSEVLGGDQTPFGMAHAFGVFADRGVPPSMTLVRKVTDRRGRVLERNMQPGDPHASMGDTMLALWDSLASPRRPVIAASTGYLVQANMRQVVERGTARSAKDAVKAHIAGKTGTLPYDVWFGGYSPERVAVAWFGADRRERPLGLSEKVNKVYGGDTALPAWTEFMARMDNGRPATLLTDRMPPNVRWLRIDRATGLLTRTGGVNIPHRIGTEPTDFAYEDGSAENIHEAETEF